MMGLLINEREHREIEYLIRRELEEILLDLEDHRLDGEIKETMKIRYRHLFKLFQRVASEQDCLKYMPKRSSTQ